MEDETSKDNADDLSTVEQVQREGTMIAMQDAVISELEKKHENEQEVWWSWLADFVYSQLSNYRALLGIENVSAN